MSNSHNRRRFLQLAGTGAAASIAGCSNIDSFGQDDGNGGGYGSSDRIGASVTPTEEAIEEFREQVESGELEQAELMEEQTRLIEEAGEDFEAYAEENDISIDESQSEFGLFVVDGSPEALVEALQEGPIGQLMTGDLYDQNVQQLQQQQQLQEGQQELDEEDLEELEEGDGDGGSDGDDTGDEDDGDGGDDNESEN